MCLVGLSFVGVIESVKRLTRIGVSYNKSQNSPVCLSLMCVNRMCC